MQEEYIKDECPKEVRKRAEILYSNGVHGVQAPDEGRSSNKDCFVICYLHVGWSDEVAIDELRKESGSKTVQEDEWIGHRYLRIHWREYPLIVSVFNTLLKLGYAFTTRNRAESYFNPSEDRLFNFEIAELKSINRLKEMIKLNPRLQTMVHYGFYDEWNYLTEEGRAFCRELRKTSYFDHGEKREDYRTWATFDQCDYRTLLNKVVLPLLDDDNDDLCVVCMEKRADTMVLPCEHNVVCKECSLQLEKDALNKDKCVKCRRDVVHVLY